MSVEIYMYGAIAILSLFGFTMMTCGERLRALPDQFDSPIRAVVFGMLSLAASMSVISVPLYVRRSLCCLSLWTG